MAEACPVCSCNSEPYVQVRERPFFKCPSCGFIFQGRATLLLPEEEKKRYLLHDNSPSNAGYVAYMKGLMEEGILPLIQGGKVLDYGCGPNPVLSSLMAQKGFSASWFDPFFFP